MGFKTDTSGSDRVFDETHGVRAEITKEPIIADVCAPVVSIKILFLNCDCWIPGLRSASSDENIIF